MSGGIRVAKVPKHIPMPGRDECWYCGDTPRLHETSIHIYNKDYGPVWQCPCCHAYVGCHPGTHKALGRVANKELRTWKMKAHAALDPLWRKKASNYIQERPGASKRCMAKSYGRARGKAYGWLSEQMGLRSDECHIGYFTIEQCKRVVEICEPHKARLRLPA